MEGGIYLIPEHGDLIEMSPQNFEREARLQEWLARYPNLLAGEQISPDEPRRWLFIQREAHVAVEPDGDAHWSIDHLFLDQDAIPTLVEVKRRRDGRIHRHVVAQMLDYAANMAGYWSAEKIREAFETRCRKDKRDPDAELAEFVGPEGNPNEFWGSVQTNLQDERIRLLFVADDIPEALRRIVEFLQRQLTHASVYAIEVKLLADTARNHQAVVPRLVTPLRTVITSPAVDTRPKNYDGTGSLDEILDLCRKHGDAVSVGYIGGENGLRNNWGSKDRAKDGSLKNSWKYRYPATNKGTVYPNNWIAGKTFDRIVSDLLNGSVGAPQEPDIDNSRA